MEIMESIIISVVIGAITGAIATFLGTGTVEYFKNRTEDSRKRKNFVVFIRLELQSISKILERLKIDLENKSFYSANALTRFQENLINLEAYRHEAIYFHNSSLQEKFLDLLSDTSFFVKETSLLETFYFEEIKKLDNGDSIFYKTRDDLENYFRGKRTEKLIEIIEIKRKIDEMTRILNRLNAKL
jgi:ribosomal protein S8